MLAEVREWRPGSFTKNFSWGKPEDGLLQLHEAIRIGFDGKLENVPRDTFRSRLARLKRPDYIPLNFFLLNQILGGTDFVVVDELVFQAIAFEHSRHFDYVALAAFNLSYVGEWRGAYSYQAYPAAWANQYVRHRVANEFHWDTHRVTADDIQRFVASDARYTGQTSRKLATNLNYMYKVGGFMEMGSETIARWWVDSVFLALDRLLYERKEHQEEPSTSKMLQYLLRADFNSLTGRRSSNKDLALQPLVSLYSACGGPLRHSPEAARERQLVMLPHIDWFANSEDPFFAIYPQDPNIIKGLPRACAMLAKHVAGFEELDPDELTDWNVLDYVRRRTRAALKALRERGVRPTMTAEQLLSITRGE
jgi:hypothetical protein